MKTPTWLAGGVATLTILFADPAPTPAIVGGGEVTEPNPVMVSLHTDSGTSPFTRLHPGTGCRTVAQQRHPAPRAKTGTCSPSGRQHHRTSE